VRFVAATLFIAALIATQVAEAMTTLVKRKVSAVAMDLFIISVRLPSDDIGAGNLEPCF
jgi:hypothetical protein